MSSLSWHHEYWQKMSMPLWHQPNLLHIFYRLLCIWWNISRGLFFVCLANGLCQWLEMLPRNDFSLTGLRPWSAINGNGCVQFETWPMQQIHFNINDNHYHHKQIERLAGRFHRLEFWLQQYPGLLPSVFRSTHRIDNQLWMYPTLSTTG